MREIAGSVNGPMLELLAEAVEHPDKNCVDFFRYGAELYGELPICGLGDAKVCVFRLHVLPSSMCMLSDQES